METTNPVGNGTACAVATALDEMALVQACKQGDSNAFEQLVKRYDSRVFRVAQHITHNREDAEDAVQEAFLKAFRNLSQFQEKSRISTWLFRITVNESLMKLRKQRRSREVSMDEDPGEMFVNPGEVADWAPNPEQVYGAVELRNILRSQLQELPPSLRTAFILRDVEGLSTEEAAEILQVTVDALKARLWRARLKLRELLTKYFGAHAARG
jgi:RNA polymerase sigma-70 factor (ECF subfamily)